MNKLICTLVLCLLTNIAFSASTDSIENVAMKIDFKLKQQDENGHVAQYVINNDLDIPVNNHEWTIIPNKKANNSSPPYLLIGKIDSIEGKKIKLIFLVVDTSTTPTVVSRPELAIVYGKKGQVKVEATNQTLDLSVTADQVIKLTSARKASARVKLT